MPFSCRAGHTRHTRKRLTTVIANRGRVYDPKRPTTPAAATANRSAIFARPYATARYARYSLFRAARIDPSVIWKHVWEVVRATLRTTRTANSGAAAALLNRRITVDNRIPMTEERPPPTRRTCHIRPRGRSTRPMNRTSPLSRPRIPIDVANEERLTRDPVIPTADEVNRCAARAQKAKPKIEFEMLPANTQPPCSRTSSVSDIGSVETVGSIQGNSQATSPRGSRSSNIRPLLEKSLMDVRFNRVGAVAASILLVVVALVGASALSRNPLGPSTLPPGGPVRDQATGNFDQLVVVLMENKNLDEVYGPATYMTQLADLYSFSEGWASITNPSQPNYIAILGGSTFGVSGDGNHPNLNHPTMVDILENTST